MLAMMSPGRNIRKAFMRLLRHSKYYTPLYIHGEIREAYSHSDLIYQGIIYFIVILLLLACLAP